MSISDEDHLQLINLGLKSESPINTLETNLKNEEGSGYLGIIKSNFKGANRLEGKYRCDEDTDCGKAEDIMSISMPLRPKSLGIEISHKQDIKIFLEKVLPQWLEQGYYFWYSALKNVENRGYSSNMIHISPDENKVVIYQPKLISNIGEIEDYCNKKAINLKVK